MNKQIYVFRLLVVFFSILTFTPRIAISQKTRQQIAQTAFPSVVLLVMEDANGQPISLGSGFFIRDGTIATNLHVVRGAERGYAKIVGQQIKNDIKGIVGIDVNSDLVLLSVDSARAPSLPLGESEKITVGDEVYVIGNPRGLEGTFSQGIVSGIRKVGLDALMQITAPISPGSSGCPVLNTQSEVIGVAVATFKGGQNLNFAIPASYLSSLLSETKPVIPLSRQTRPRQKKSILDDLGGRSTEGVIGTLFKWWYDGKYGPGSYSFSLRNRLREPVKNIYCLVIFYTRANEPIDVDAVEYTGIIPAGLAKRLESMVDMSVQDLAGPTTALTKVEFRILDFQTVQ